jgi:hypothetical protein
MFKYGIKSLLISEKKFEAKNPHRFEKRQNRKTVFAWKQRLMSFPLSTNWRMKLVADFTNILRR